MQAVGNPDGVSEPEHLKFDLDPPDLPQVSISSMEYIYEFSTALLFSFGGWARTVLAFGSLGRHDQLALLQNSWQDIFLLGVAQCSGSVPFSLLVTFATAHPDENMFRKVVAFWDFVSNLKRSNVDNSEYGLLRAIVIFNADCPNLENPAGIESFQEKAYSCLKNYTEQRWPEQPNRFAKLLFRLPAMNSLGKELVEELFLTPLLGTASIEDIMESILPQT